MRTFLQKMSLNLSLPETPALTHTLTRYSQLLIYLMVLGVIAYLYVTAQGLFLQYLSGLSPGALTEHP